jgi:hypothetical protein
MEILMKTVTYTRFARDNSSGRWVSLLASLAISASLCGGALAEQTGYDLNYDALELMPASLPLRPVLSDALQVSTSEVIRRFTTSFDSTATDYLKSLIASVEAASAGYDAVVHSAWVKPKARPTDMTIKKIYDWIDATPNQNHAIGRYQIIPATLRRLVAKSGLPLSSKYSATTQDFLADILLEEAGYRSFLNGSLSQGQFMNKLARIWGRPLFMRSFRALCARHRAVSARRVTPILLRPAYT